MSGDGITSVALTADRYQAIYLHLFVTQRRSLEGAPGSWISAEFLPDTCMGKIFPQVSGYYVGGSWGRAELGGSNWPDRWIVRNAAEGGETP